MENERLIRKFDKQAKIYETRRRSGKGREMAWRQRLIRSAKGKVLEVGIGAGANFPFYRDDVEVTGVDFSGEMLSRARVAAVECGVRAEFMQSDIETLTFPDGTFDTVVTTLTMCGYKDPLAVLGKFNRWCKANGQILLMEHGASSNRMIGALQKAIDPLFHRMVGCHLNRDMSRIFQESGMEVIRTERHMLGAVYLVWGKPAADSPAPPSRIAAGHKGP